MSYVLLNPYLEGKQISSNKKDINLAAEEIWSNVSTHIKNYVPEFYFTVKEMSGGALHHFKVKESLEQNKVNYSLKALKAQKYHKMDKSLLNEIANLQKGGRHHKRHDSSSSSSSSSSDDLTYKFSSKPSNPVLALNYYPSIYGVSNILLPSFVSNFTPYYKLNIPIVSPNVIVTYN
jgi:hypothetical protein